MGVVAEMRITEWPNSSKSTSGRGPAPRLVDTKVASKVALRRVLNVWSLRTSRKGPSMVISPTEADLGECRAPR